MKPKNVIKLVEAAYLKDRNDGHDIRAVQTGYADCIGDDPHNIRMLEFSVNFYNNISHLLTAVKTSIGDGYNGFDYKHLCQIIYALCFDNEGKPKEPHLHHYEFRFGRESSPVLYIRYTGSRVWMKTFQELIKVSGADEISIEQGGEIRLWWD